MMKKILIAGASSFIGRELVKQLIDKYQIIALVRSQNQLISYRSLENIRVVEADMNEYPRIIRHIGNFDYYIVLSWDGTRREDRNNLDKNSKSYRAIFESIKAAIVYGQCKKILTIGSQTVYDSTEVEIHDQLVPHPSTHYAKMKLQLYKHASKYCVAQNVTLNEIRFWNVYGKGDGDYKMLNDTIMKLVTGKDILVRDSDKNWDFLHVIDAARLICSVLNVNAKCGKVYLPLDGRRDSLGKFIKRIALMCDSQSNIIFEKGLDHIDKSYHRCDISKLKKELNWEPIVSFEEGITEMIEYEKERLFVK